MSELKNVPVYSGHLANYLLNRGYTIKCVGGNKYVKGKTIFYFKDEGDILKDIRLYTEVYK